MCNVDTGKAPSKILNSSIELVQREKYAFYVSSVEQYHTAPALTLTMES